MAAARKPEPVDAVIVGAGASGGVVAKVLSEAGLSVVGLEKGPWLRPKEHFSGDELKYVNRSYIWPDPLLNPRTVREDENSDTELFPFSPSPQLVGGGTVHYAGWMPRAMPSDFRQHTLHGDIDGANLADWPISYDDLEPYFTKVEWEFGVSGLEGANAHEPPMSKGYPSPPLPPTRYGKKFYEACERMGINSYPLPHALVTTPHNGRDPSNWTSFWNQYGDPTTTRSTTLTSLIPEAVETGRYDLRADSYVREITLHPDGRAKGVIYIDGEGREVEQEASLVILCQGAIESSRLLQLSTSNQFPDGLANSSGLVGKNATFHEYLFAIGFYDKEADDPLSGFAGNYISGGSLEFYETDESRGHIGGCIIAASQTCHPINWIFPGRPAWGSAAKDADRDFFNHATKIGLILHDMPVET
ncbi:MAG: GMC family oxidoreductase N-terminal domain-containing protein, partial [Gaiellaceae bacterium]